MTSFIFIYFREFWSTFNCPNWPKCLPYICDADLLLKITYYHLAHSIISVWNFTSFSTYQPIHCWLWPTDLHEFNLHFWRWFTLLTYIVTHVNIWSVKLYKLTLQINHSLLGLTYMYFYDINHASLVPLTCYDVIKPLLWQCCFSHIQA